MLLQTERGLRRGGDARDARLGRVAGDGHAGLVCLQGRLQRRPVQVGRRVREEYERHVLSGSQIRRRRPVELEHEQGHDNACNVQRWNGWNVQRRRLNLGRVVRD